MTYRELIKLLQKMPDGVLDQSVVIEINGITKIADGIENADDSNYDPDQQIIY